MAIMIRCAYCGCPPGYHDDKDGNFVPCTYRGPYGNRFECGCRGNPEAGI